MIVATTIQIIKAMIIIKVLAIK